MPNFYNILRARKFTTVADTAVEISAHDSATPNFSIEAGGKLKWSSGSENPDTTLYRSAANTLKTDDSFDIAAGHTYKIDGDDVLTSTSLGSTVVNSSLTSLGNLVSLNAATPSFVGPTTIDGSLTVTGTLIASNFEGGGGGGGGSLYAEVIGNNTGSVFIINHNLGTRDVFVSFRENGDNYENLNVAWEATSEDSITVNFGTPPATDSVKVLVYGSVSGEITNLNDILDVDAATPSLNQILKWDGSYWANSDPIFDGITAGSISIGTTSNTEISAPDEMYITTEDSAGHFENGIYIQPGDNIGFTGQWAIVRAGGNYRDSAIGVSTGGKVIISGGAANGGGSAVGGIVEIEGGVATDSSFMINGSVDIGTVISDSVNIGRNGKTTFINGSLDVKNAFLVNYSETGEGYNIDYGLELFSSSSPTAMTLTTAFTGEANISSTATLSSGGLTFETDNSDYVLNISTNSIYYTIPEDPTPRSSFQQNNIFSPSISTNELTVNGKMSFQQTTEQVNSSSIVSNIMTCDYTTGAIYYQSTNPSANFTLNFTNVPTTNNKAITFTIFVTQGGTGYIPNALQIDGSAQTIKWAQGSTPVPTANKIDIFSFTLIRLSGSWTVFGNANTNF
jgi:hypothetical protein